MKSIEKDYEQLYLNLQDKYDDCLETFYGIEQIVEIGFVYTLSEDCPSFGLFEALKYKVSKINKIMISNESQ